MDTVLHENWHLINIAITSDWYRMHVFRKFSLKQILLPFVKRPGHRNVRINCKPAMSFESKNTKTGNGVTANYRVESSGGSRISPRRGRQLSGGAPTYDFVKISPKLHEIERIWTPRGARVQNFTMWIRHWKGILMIPKCKPMCFLCNNKWTRKLFSWRPTSLLVYASQVKRFM